jgi:eukaryotic-like serine/threonine-protein kinase
MGCAMTDALKFIKEFEPLWGSWYVEKLIGEGSQSKVFLITKNEWDTRYTSALKVFRVAHKHTQEELKKDILDEISLLYALRGDSHIVVYEDHQIIDNPQDQSFLVFLRMEYLTSLTDFLLETETFTLDSFFNMALDLCSAMAFCHNQNIIHRDIKPDNIFLKDRTFKLGDFSVSKKVDALNTSYTSVGTPIFSAPEVILNQPYDVRADLYSFGLVLYQILNANRLPFVPNHPLPLQPSDLSFSIAQRLKGETLPALQTLGDLSLKLGGFLQTCCAFDPQNRFQSARALKTELYEIYKTLPSEALERTLFLGNETKETSTNQDHKKPLPKTEHMHPHSSFHLAQTEYMGSLSVADVPNPSPSSASDPARLFQNHGNVMSGSLMLSNQTHYFISNVQKDFSLLKQDKHSGKTQLLLKDFCWHLTLIHKDLFFTSGKHQDRIYKIHIDTHALSLFSPYAATHLVGTKSHLYFINKDENHRIWRQALDASSAEIFVDDYAKEFILLEDGVWYVDAENHLCHQAENTKTHQTIGNVKAKYLNHKDGHLYFINPDRQDGMDVFDLTTHVSNPITPFPCHNLNLAYDTLFFSHAKDNHCLYSSDLTGHHLEKLWQHPSEYIHVLDEKIFFIQTTDPKERIVLHLKKNREKQ